MTADHERAIEILSAINPADLSYDEWLRTGMAVKHAGLPLSAWDDWSRADSRYKPKVCADKWASFKGKASSVTIASLVEIAKRYGYDPRSHREEDDRQPGQAFAFEDFIPRKVAAPAAEWVEREDITIPKQIGAMDFARYLSAMFEPEELVGISVDCFQPEGKDKWLPLKGVCDQTAAQLIAACKSAKNGDLGSVIGDVQQGVGAWVRINPLDGKGFKDENVTRYRHALLEADDGDLGQQLGIIREMKVPVTCIVHSGGKSIHALVRIEADSYDEYRRRVDYLFKQAVRFGLKVDAGNRNPSRLSRLPGVMRGDKPQFVISWKEGEASWESWVDFVEDWKDDLPNIEELSDSYDDPPPHNPEIIPGLIRAGDKLVLAGPSNAGKSFSMIQLCIAIAEGTHWLQWKCNQGTVLYINAELHRSSGIRRFIETYRALGLKPTALRNIKIWNLRGKVKPLDKLVSKIIRRSAGMKFRAIVIDPIYMLATGDENSAEDMGEFMNLIDRIAEEIGCAVVFSHHHSKGAQGGKGAMDRASGSGVVARSTDAMIDLLPLPILPDRRQQLKDRMLAQAVAAAVPDFDQVPEEDRNPFSILSAAQRAFPKLHDALRETAYDAHTRADYMSGWRVEVGKLREFRKPPAFSVWFDYPLHIPDRWNLLLDVQAPGEHPPKGKPADKAKQIRDRSDDQQKALEIAVEKAGGEGASVKDVAESLGITPRAVRNRCDSSAKWFIVAGLFSRKGGANK
jgi:RecA-family ATPase